MTRTAALLLLAAACASVALACGKYGPPVRGDRGDAPVQREESSEEATP